MSDARSVMWLCACLAVACGGEGGESADRVSAVVGPEGGALTLPGGPTLTIPAGALLEPVEISIEREDSVIEAPGFSQVGDAFSFGPEGTEFLLPALLSFDGAADRNAIAHRHGEEVEVSLGAAGSRLTAGLYSFSDGAAGDYTNTGPVLASPELRAGDVSDGPIFYDRVWFEIEMEPSTTVYLRIYFASGNPELPMSGWPVSGAVYGESGGFVALANEWEGDLAVSADAGSDRVSFALGAPAGLPNGGYVLTVVRERSWDPTWSVLVWGNAQFIVTGDDTDCLRDGCAHPNAYCEETTGECECLPGTTEHINAEGEQHCCGSDSVYCQTDEFPGSCWLLNTDCDTIIFCGGEWRGCPEGETSSCVAGVFECTGGCEPQCTGRECGPDGCGGTCAPGCVAPQVCETSSGLCCTPTTCADEGAECDTIEDGCGNTLVCPVTCSLPETCGGGGIPNVCGCTPTTCEEEGAECGTIDDGCGTTLVCPDTCVLPETCEGGGVPNQCNCAGTTCEDEGAECGTIEDPCGGTIDCPDTCVLPETCEGGGIPNTCGCTPTSCVAEGAECGTLDDGCGTTLVCPDTCVSPETCEGGGVPNQCGCTPTTCAAEGAQCGTIDDGCGSTLECPGTCTPPETCGGAGLDNVCGQPWLEVGAGAYHSCGLRLNGTLSCWGAGAPGDPVDSFPHYGQSSPPAGTYSDLSVGTIHNCAIATDGSIACWGNNDYGKAVPPGGNDYAHVIAGGSHSCAIKNDDTVVCWGDDYYGQSTPTAGTYSQLALGYAHTCGVKKSDSTVACWGVNYEDQATPPGGTFTQLSADEHHTCGVTTGNAVLCWGGDYYGEASPPADSFLRVSCGRYHSCGVRADDTIVCWGEDQDDKLNAPAGSYAEVSSSDDHNCALTLTGGAVCWGSDSYGQCTIPVCGDGVCEGSESCEWCEIDCGACFCGDGLCTSDEDCDLCPEDCGDCPCVPPTCDLIFYDAVSGLMWENPSTLDATATRSGAYTHCAGLVYAGYDDWRLPSIDELRSLIRGCPATETGGSCGYTDTCTDFLTCAGSGCSGCTELAGPGAGGCYWDATLHGNCAGAGMYFWSSTYDEIHTTLAYEVSFARAWVEAAVVDNTLQVRCVRDYP